MNEFFSNPTASHGLVTDRSRYFVVKKTGGTINGEANFALSLPIGNRGPLNLSSLVNDLSPLPAALPLLVHKPLGLMLALSLDEDTPPSTSLASSIPVVAPQPDRVKLGGEGSGSRARESTRSSARIAEAVPTSKGVAKKLVLQSITPSEEGPESDSGQPVRLLSHCLGLLLMGQKGRRRCRHKLLGQRG